MQEIEIKFKIDDLEKVKEKLQSLGCVLSDELNQKDCVFVPDINDTSNEEGKIFTRIRKENDRIELTLKKQSKRIMQSKEIEFQVSDFDKAKDFLETLGLQVWVTVEKKRVTTKYKNFNICMDEVKRLGQFIEIEVLTEDENNTEFYENQILDLCKELKIDSNHRIDSFYDTMISELDN